MITIRELIIQELIARAAVMVIPAYATGIGATVLRAQKEVGSTEVCPCTVIWPEPETTDYKHGMNLNKMPVLIEGHALYGALNASSVAELILGDLVKCFTSPAWDRRRAVTGQPGTYNDPYAESIIYQGGGTPEYPKGGETSIFASARFLISYWSTAGDPAAQA